MLGREDFLTDTKKIGERIKKKWKGERKREGETLCNELESKNRDLS